MGYQIASLTTLPAIPGVDFYVFHLSPGSASSPLAGQLDHDFIALAEALGSGAALIRGAEGYRLSTDLEEVVCTKSRVSDLVHYGTHERAGLLILAAHPRALGDDDLVLFLPHDILESSPDLVPSFFHKLGFFARTRDASFLQSFVEAGPDVSESIRALATDSPYLGVGLNLARAIGPPADPDSVGLPTAPVHATDPEDTLLAPGHVIANRYVVTKTLGRGGMGDVYLATDQHYGARSVAVKIVRRDRFAVGGFDLFRRELDILITLDQIPDLIRVLDSNLNGDAPYIATEYIQGWNLAEFIPIRCPSRKERLELFCRICETVDAVHDQGVLHRDIKPENILIRRQRLGGRLRFVICDFGVAGEVAQSVTSQDVMGTIAYMSPEHFRGISAMTRRSDVYSLGVILYWLLVERLPRPSTADSVLRADSADFPWGPAALPELHVDKRGLEHGVPASLAAITYKALSSDPTERFQSAQELCDAIEGL